MTLSGGGTLRGKGANRIKDGLAPQNTPKKRERKMKVKAA
jgi:hypothetical protein